jgi:hypothetical protein
MNRNSKTGIISLSVGYGRAGVCMRVCVGNDFEVVNVMNRGSGGVSVLCLFLTTA